jgi:hypothetical protein
MRRKESELYRRGTCTGGGGIHTEQERLQGRNVYRIGMFTQQECVRVRHLCRRGMCTWQGGNEYMGR